MRIALIGAGCFGQNHKLAISKRSDCKLAAVCDLNLGRALALVEGTDAKIYADYHEMLAQEQLDGVILNLPHFLHKSVTIDCLEQGVAVLVEKPMALSVAECDAMIEASQRTQMPLTVGHLSSYIPATRRIKELVKKETLGKLCSIVEIRNKDYFTNRPEWFLDKKLSGGGITMNLGAHFIDKVLYVTDALPERIVATGNNFLTDHTVEAASHVQLTLTNGVIASGTYCGSKGAEHQETTFFFTNGIAQIRGGMELWMSEGNAPLVKIDIEDADTIFEHALETELQEFLKLIRGEENCATKVEHARNVICVLEQALSQI